MTTFDNRERGFEAHYALDQEQEFKAQVRRDRKIGQWAGEQLGLAGDDLAAYVQSIVREDLKEAGDEDVLRKVVGDLAEKGVTAETVRTQMDALLQQARLEIKEGR